MKILFTLFSCILFNLNFNISLHAQSTGDFQSNTTGNWNALSTWERWDGSSWITPAPNVPTSADGVITILSGDTVTVTANVSADQVIVNAGGNLETTANLTIANGTEN